MFSRAHLLIERDLARLQSDKLWGIEASPLTDDNIFEWLAKIRGLRGTLWEDGIFHIYLKFDENYNKKPPEVSFHTIPFHPNVDMVTGQPCVDFLDDLQEWKEGYNISMLLLTIQAMLSNPVLENAVNPNAVEMILKVPVSYKQMVLDCVAASQRLEAGLNPHLEQEKVRFAPSEQDVVREISPQPNRHHKTPISFEDYHITWCGIATSKPNPDAGNPLLVTIQDNAVLQEAHYGMPVGEMHELIKKQLQEKSRLMYGNFQARPTEDEVKKSKLDKVDQMRKIYLGQKKAKSPVAMSNEELKALSQGKSMDKEHWEEEVDDLVAWTQNLDEGML